MDPDASPSRPEVPLALAAINTLPAADFLATFGDVAEHAPWVAETAATERPWASREALIAAFAAAIDRADAATQLALLRAHPDLAGRAAIAGDIAAESRREQAGAGLDRLSPQEFARFTDFNDRYRARFGHPFILAVKGATKDQILAAFAARIDNDAATERTTALGEVQRIVRFRLEERVLP